MCKTHQADFATSSDNSRDKDGQGNEYVLAYRGIPYELGLFCLNANVAHIVDGPAFLLSDICRFGRDQRS